MRNYRFVLILAISCACHAALYVCGSTALVQPAQLPAQQGKISVELMPVRASTPTAAQQPRVHQRKVVKKKRANIKPVKKTKLEPLPKKRTPKKKPAKTPKVKKALPKAQPKETQKPAPTVKEPQPRKKESQPKKTHKQPKKKMSPVSQSPSAPRPKSTSAVPESSGISSPARLIANQKLRYPEAARLAGIEGRVALRLQISNAGQVTQANLHRSSGSNILDQAALRGAYTLRYFPARRNGAPVQSTRIEYFNYRLVD